MTDHLIRVTGSMLVRKLVLLLLLHCESVPQHELSTWHRNLQRNFAVPPSVLDGLQLQVNPKTLYFFYFSPCLSHWTGIIIIIIYFTVTVRMWWICDFSSQQCFISPEVDWNLQALLQLDSLVLLLTLVKTSCHLQAEPKPVQLCLAAAARAGHPNTAHVSDIHEANWVQMMYGALHNHTTVFSGTIYLSKLKICFKF